jgi:hypothetical protein
MFGQSRVMPLDYSTTGFGGRIVVHGLYYLEANPNGSFFRKNPKVIKTKK